PERLALLRESSFRGQGASSYITYSRLRSGLAGKTFEDVAAISMPRPVSVATPGGEPVTAVRENVTANYFKVLGVNLVAGEDFGAPQEKIGAAAVAIVSESFASSHS